MTPALAVVSEARAPSDDNLGTQVRRLQQEAREPATTHAQCLELALVAVSKLAAEVAEGGEAYPTGVRDLARRTAAYSYARAQTIHAILGRAFDSRCSNGADGDGR